MMRHVSSDIDIQVIDLVDNCAVITFNRNPPHARNPDFTGSSANMIF